MLFNMTKKDFAVIVVLLAIACFVISLTMYWVITSNLENHKEPNSEDIDVVYSNDLSVAIVQIPYNINDHDEMNKIANVVSMLSQQGYEYKGMFHSDTGFTMAHFLAYLLFEKAD